MALKSTTMEAAVVNRPLVVAAGANQQVIQALAAQLLFSQRAAIGIGRDGAIGQDQYALDHSP